MSIANIDQSSLSTPSHTVTMEDVTPPAASADVLLHLQSETASNLPGSEDVIDPEPQDATQKRMTQVTYSTDHYCLICETELRCIVNEASVDQSSQCNRCWQWFDWPRFDWPRNWPSNWAHCRANQWSWWLRGTYSCGSLFGTRDFQKKQIRILFTVRSSIVRILIDVVIWFTVNGSKSMNVYIKISIYRCVRIWVSINKQYDIGIIVQLYYMLYSAC